MTKIDKDNDKDILRTPPKNNPRDLLHLRHWLRFRQLRTWMYNHLGYLGIKSDIGQHSQFLRYWYFHQVIGKQFKFLFGNFLFTRLISSHKGHFKGGLQKKTPWKFVQFTKGICLKLKIYLSKVKNVHLFQIQICLMLLIVARLILFGLKQYYMPCYCWSQGQQLWKGKIMKMTMVVVARQFSFQPFVMCKYWESGIGQVCSSHHQLIFGFCSTKMATDTEAAMLFKWHRISWTLMLS